MCALCHNSLPFLLECLLGRGQHCQKIDFQNIYFQAIITFQSNWVLLIKPANITTQWYCLQAENHILDHCFLARYLMTDENTPLGRVTVSPRAIATIAYQAARQSYGVVGLTSKNLMEGITQVIVKDPTHGIEVKYDDQKITIDIYVIIEYGTRIKSVASSVSNTIKFNVEKALGMPVEEVNVHVRGLRVSDTD
jgi:uncharacterized alkaline shock family protein YloU